MPRTIECSPVKRTRFHDIDEVINFLKSHGEKVGQLHRQGVKAASEVVRWYEFLWRSPGDPGAQAFLMVALEDYLEALSRGDFCI